MTTHRLINNFEVCVPESQRHEYELVVGKERVITHPDTVRGLTPKLNWMFDNCPDDHAVVFLDDDLVGITRCFVPQGSSNTSENNPEVVEEIIAATAQLAEDAGAFMFGWETSVSTILYYDGLAPFALTGYINGCAMGYMNGHGLRFDERIVAKNDYDICLLNAWKHRVCFKDLRYAFSQKETFTGAGGQSAHRNSETEKRDVQLLIEKYGDVIKIGAKSGVRKRDYAGAQKVTLRLPY